MNIIERIKTIPEGSAVILEYPAIRMKDTNTVAFQEMIDIPRLLALAESHERLLAAAKDIADSIHGMMSPEDKTRLFALDKAIGEAKKLHEETT